jgi:hypothetical protein
VPGECPAADPQPPLFGALDETLGIPIPQYPGHALAYQHRHVVAYQHRPVAGRLEDRVDDRSTESTAACSSRSRERRRDSSLTEALRGDIL